MLGDIVGRVGRRAVAQMLPRLNAELAPDFVVANAENAAGGLGITRETALPIFAAGVDAMTLGNHTWAQKDTSGYFGEETRILRPLNYPPGVPGRGWGIYPTKSGARVGVINLIGRIFMDPVDCPFRAADHAIEQMRSRVAAIVVDMHGEATSEKNAMGWHLDGRVAAVLGTHTHIQTSDERILPRGAGYITDVGMVGPEDSVLGQKVEAVVSKFLTGMPARFETADGPAIFCGVSLDIDDSSGACVAIRRVQLRERKAAVDAAGPARVQSDQKG